MNPDKPMSKDASPPVSTDAETLRAALQIANSALDAAAATLADRDATIERLNRECEQRLSATQIAQDQAMQNGAVSRRFREALEGATAAIRTARNMVPDEEVGLAAKLFAYHLNEADTAIIAALDASATGSQP